jgi:hypothetical protein
MVDRFWIKPEEKRAEQTRVEGHGRKVE